MGDDKLEREVRIDAKPETVFDVLTDPDQVKRWWSIALDVDARPGGVYRVDINGRNTACGEFVEVDRPNRVVHTFGWDGDDTMPCGSTTVEWTITADGDGSLLRLVHSGLPTDRVEAHTQGWEHYLPRITTVAQGGDPGRDAMLDEPADATT